MTITPQLMTADNLLRITDDGYRYELVQGELRRMSPAGHHHGRLLLNITTPLDTYVRAHTLGVVYAAETGFLLATNPDTVRAPDAAFVSQQRVQALGNTEGYWPGAPELVIEMISPNDLYTEVEEKVIDWLQAGTSMIVVVNPRKRIVTVYRSLSDITILSEQDILDGAEVVPGWHIPVRDIFA